MDQCLLSLVVTPSIENAVTDWLLERGNITGFTSALVSGHGVSIHSMTAAEQVAGRQKQVLIQMHLSMPVAQEILESIHQTFSGSGIHYWISPLVSVGRVD